MTVRSAFTIQALLLASLAYAALMGLARLAIFQESPLTACSFEAVVGLVAACTIGVPAYRVLRRTGIGGIAAYVAAGLCVGLLMPIILDVVASGLLTIRSGGGIAEWWTSFATDLGRKLDTAEGYAGYSLNVSAAALASLAFWDMARVTSSSR